MNSRHENLPIVQTKFCIPRLGERFVERERLLGSMDNARGLPLVLVSAPAGYGKSVLVSQWLSRQSQGHCWLSLDSTDDDLHQFLTYLVACIQDQFPTACSSTAELLLSTQTTSASLAASLLLNDLSALDEPCAIVLDDYHHIQRASQVHELLENVLLHPPPQVQLIIITRQDPPLPLTRYRALNQLADIRLQDLQFNQAESASLLIADNDFEPSELALTNLQSEVEGWAVGLRLVSLVLRRSENPEEFLKSLHGGIPNCREYLITEVLAELDPEVREYLLMCSLLDRFCAELIDHTRDPSQTVGSAENLSGASFVALLKEQNLFVIELDDKGGWVRFHHLFRDLLRSELQRTHAAEKLADYHIRASHWFESYGLIDEAIGHAVKAEDYLFAARIIERHCYDNLQADRVYVLNRQLEQIPAEISRQRPILLLARAWVASFRQQIDQVQALVEEIDPLLHGKKGLSGLRGELEFFQGWLQFWSGNFEASVRHHSKAQKRIDRHKHTQIAETDLHLALALHMLGRGASAVDGIETQIAAFGGLQLGRRIGTIAFIRCLEANLNALEFESRRMRAPDRMMRTPLTDAWGVYFEGFCNLQRLVLDTAIANFSAAVSRPHTIDRRAAVDAFAALALAQQLSGDPDSANRTLTRLNDFVNEWNDPDIHVVAASCAARLLVNQGKPIPATNLPSTGLSDMAVFDLFLWVESTPVTQVRLLIEMGTEESLAAAQALSEELLDTSERCHLHGQIIEICALQSILLDRQGKRREALEKLNKVLLLAAQGGWLRPFVELGEPMVELLKNVQQDESSAEFVGEILAAFGRLNRVSPEAAFDGTERHPSPSQEFGPDALTNRELDILELLAQRMRNKEIANHLYISTHTVKDHLKHIYQKLGVGNRREAVATAIASGILPPQ